MAKNDKLLFSLNAEVAERYKLKESVQAPIISISGVVGEIDFRKLTIAEIEAYPMVQEYLDKK